MGDRAASQVTMAMVEQQGDVPLTGVRIVVTRPAEQAEGFARALRELGAAVRIRPLVSVAPPSNPAALIQALARLDSFDWVAFTSANAVRACLAAAPAVAGWPAVACVGPATGQAAELAGLGVALRPAVFTGEALAVALLQHEPAPRRVFWPRASGASAALGNALRAGGVEVEEVEAYRTVPDPGAAGALAAELEASPADVLVFTSPSAIRTFAAAAGPMPDVAVAVIGTVTAAAAAQAGWQVQVVSGQHSIEGLIGALLAWHAGRSAGGSTG